MRLEGPGGEDTLFVSLAAGVFYFPAAERTIMLPERLYRVEDAANLLALQPSTLRKLIHNGAIAIVRPTSRAVRIAESEIVRIQREGLRPRRTPEADL